MHAVEDKYLQNPVFDAFSGPCYTLLASQKTFGLHPSELFYQCLFIIDMIKPQSISEAQQYCLTKVGGELHNYLQEKTALEDTSDFILVKGQILLSVAMFLEWSGDGKYVPLYTILTNEAVRILDDETKMILRKFHCDCMKYYNMNALKDFAKSYVKSEVFLSEEIEDMLDELPTGDEQGSGVEVARLVHLANGKKTALVILLKKMYEKGWLVDAEGHNLSNRDEAIKDIMKNAFGEEKVSPSQLLSTIKNRNKTLEEIDYIKELFE